jgi:cell division protein FtsW (lipid II flippase)
MSEETPMIPKWICALALGVLVLAMSQTTVQQLAWRAAGVRAGMLTKVEADTKAHQTVCHDAFAVYRDGELQGTALWLGDASFPVLDNGRTWILVEGGAKAVEGAAGEKMRYKTGFATKSGLAGLALKVPGLPFTPADLLLGFCFAAIVLVQLQRKDLSTWWLPPWSIVILLAICGLTLVDGLRVMDQSEHTVSRGKGMREWLQYAEVLAAGFIVFRMTFRSRCCRQLAAWTLIGVCGVVTAVGLVEYAGVISGRGVRGLLDVAAIDSTFGFRYNPTRSGMSGSESSRNVLALYLAIMLPLLTAVALNSGDRRRQVLAAVVGVLALPLILNAALLLCAVAGCLAVAVQSPRQRAVPGMLVILALVIGGACLTLPHHGKILMDSVAVTKYDDPYGSLPMPLTGHSADTVEQTGAQWEPVQQKYLEMQTAMNAVSVSPLFGHGLGHYQVRINAFYTDGVLQTLWINKNPANFMERDAHGLYVVQSVESGLLGFLALVAVLLGWLTTATAARDETDDPFDKTLAMGVVGCMVTLLLCGFAGSFLVRGLQFTVIAIAALTAGMRDQ